MRWIITLWTFYLMALSSLSCSDAQNQCEGDGPTIEIVQSHDHDQDSDDKCSPFCYCNCCSVSIGSFEFKNFEIKQPKAAFITKKITARNYTLISRNAGNIWNPPKFTA
jgi:hypothetical protein